MYFFCFAVRQCPPEAAEASLEAGVKRRKTCASQGKGLGHMRARLHV